MKTHGNVSIPTSESKDNELDKMSEREFRRLLIKIISEQKEDSNKEINEVRKLIQDLDKKVSNTEKEFSNKMEIMENNQVEMLKMKTSDKIKQKKEYYRWRTRSRNYFMQTIIKIKKKNDTQELWDTNKRPNLRIHGMEEGDEIQTKGTGNLLNEIFSRKFPKIYKRYRHWRHLKIQIDVIRKRTTP